MKRMQKDKDMLEAYDFSKGVQGKYAKRYMEGTNVIVIEPDVVKFFPDHDAVNQALRSLAEIIKKQKDVPNKPLKRTTKSDYQSAAEIWRSHQEKGLSSEAEWQANRLSGCLPLRMIEMLEKEPATVRVKTIQLYEQKKAVVKAGTLSQRVKPNDLMVWKQFIKQAREAIALECVT